MRRHAAAVVLAVGCVVTLAPAAYASGARSQPVGPQHDVVVGTTGGRPGAITGALPGAGGTGSAPEPTDPVASTPAVGSSGRIDDAVRQDARRFGWPLALGLAVVAFLALQGRVERHERKLADAPLDQGERLRFR